MGVGWWMNVPSLELSKKGAPCWGAVIPVAEMAMRFFAAKISPSAHVLWFASQRQSQHCLNRKHTLDCIKTQSNPIEEILFNYLKL